MAGDTWREMLLNNNITATLPVIMLSEPSDDDYSSRCRRWLAAGGCWWPQLPGCRPTLGSIPLSVSRLAVMSIMSTLSSLQSPRRHIPRCKVHFMEIWSNQDKERCKVSNVTNPNKILSSFVKLVFDFSQGSF